MQLYTWFACCDRLQSLDVDVRALQQPQPLTAARPAGPSDGLDWRAVLSLRSWTAGDLACSCLQAPLPVRLRAYVRPQPNSDRTGCDVCGHGLVSTDGAGCVDCPAGWVPGVSSAASYCFDCLQGRFAFNVTFSCEACPSGSFSLNAATSCYACQPGEGIDPGGAGCVNCPNGRADLDSNGVTPPPRTSPVPSPVASS